LGFLGVSEGIVAQAIAQAMHPQDPPDISRWCEENLVFDARSPMPGPFSMSRFEFLRDIHATLSPEHPAREVTVRGSAQWGKTVSVIQPTLGAWFAHTALDALVVHPTQSAASEWVNNKWLPMRRQAPDLVRVFGAGGGSNKDAMFNQETLERTGSLKIASSGSPADLTGTSRRLVVMDDISKYDMTPQGDPEALAVSRASGFEDAKILRVSTPMIAGTCRITRAFMRSDQRFFHVPCPHCENFAPLTWDNFKARLDPDNLQSAHFTCEACGGIINHGHKEAMVKRGRWVAHNPAGDHPGFHLWRAYAPQRDWASIAIEYAQAMGWQRSDLVDGTEAATGKDVEAETEQTFWNDVLGLPFEMANSGPSWQALRDRVEGSPNDYLPRGVLPSAGFILTAGVDCQQDRMEVQIVAFGRDYQRWVVDYIVIPHQIGDAAGRDALDDLLKTTWRTEKGLRIRLDVLAIDSGNWTEDVWKWGKSWPWSRVILVKGANTASGPILSAQKFQRRDDGKVKKAQKRAFMVNVSQLKAEFYGWLDKKDPAERGFTYFARALGDEFYRMIASEVRVLKRARSGVVTSSWELAEPGRRNEALDTMIYAEAAARRHGWSSMTDEKWQALAGQRAGAPDEAQDDVPEIKTAPKKTPKPAPDDLGDDWLGTARKSWL